MLTIMGFWGVWLALVTARAAAMGWPDQGGMLVRRLAMMEVGVALAWTVHRILKALTARSLAVRIATALLLSVPATIAFAVLNSLVFYRWFPVVSVAGDLARWNPDTVIVTAIADGLVTWYFFFAAWTAFYLAIGFIQQVREAERATAKAAAESQAARLAMLRLQVDPHFLFNALNALASLVIRQETKAAGAMIRDLAAFFRAGLVADPAADITLGEEIEYQQLYLAIERARFGNRLEVSVEMPEPLTKLKIPALLMQPLVENAVKHGLGTTSAPVRITISAWREGEQLHLSVVDDAQGHSDAAQPEQASTHIGLANVRDRLVTRFGVEAKLNAHRQDQGWVSEIIIPIAAAAHA